MLSWGNMNMFDYKERLLSDKVSSFLKLKGPSLEAVFRIDIFLLGLPDPLVRGMDPDHFIILLSSSKNCFKKP
jgi:hypothetical protein